LVPCTVRSAPWLVGLLNAERNVTTGASYVKVCVVTVPTTLLIERKPESVEVSGYVARYPAGDVQRTRVVVVHVAVEHMALPT
jgi:ABC-type enterobactin transport system permease subunit